MYCHLTYSYLGFLCYFRVSAYPVHIFQVLVRCILFSFLCLICFCLLRLVNRLNYVACNSFKLSIHCLLSLFQVFWLIPPTEENLQAYESWTLSAKQGDVFFGDTVSTCYHITLEAGWTFFIPTGNHYILHVDIVFAFCQSFILACTSTLYVYWEALKQ